MKTFLVASALSIGLSGYTGLAQAQDIASGEKVFKKCAACHKVGPEAKNGVGPVLNDLFGRPAGSFEGFKYSKTLQAAKEAGLVWDPETVAAFIADSTAFMKEYLDDPKARTKMSLKLKDAEDRQDVVAYLQQFSEPMEPEGDEEEQTEEGDEEEQDDAALMPLENKVCVQNASVDSHFFAAEGKGVERITATLSPGESLCATARGDGWSGVVSVYETATGIEGCSRLVKTGTVEQMLKYVDFDRCLWSSNSPV